MDWTEATAAIQDLINDSFGETVVFKPLAGSNQSIQAVFSNSYVSVNLGDGAPVTSLGPNLTLKLSDLDADPRAGDRVEIRGTDYRVIECQEDGEGGATLLLHR